MAEARVNFNLRLPVDLDAAVREEAKLIDKSINDTLIELLRHALRVR